MAGRFGTRGLWFLVTRHRHDYTNPSSNWTAWRCRDSPPAAPRSAEFSWRSIWGEQVVTGQSEPYRSDDWPLLVGTYTLFIHVARDVDLQVGRLGAFPLSQGVYAYVGSAYGPGGLRARLQRHLSDAKRLHWHIDYLTQLFPVGAALGFAGAEARECSVVQRLLRQPGHSVPARGFGSSDCRRGCPAHLIRLATPGHRSALGVPVSWLIAYWKLLSPSSGIDKTKR